MNPAEVGAAIALAELPRMGPKRLRDLLEDRSPAATWSGIAEGTVPLPPLVTDAWRARAAIVDPVDRARAYAEAGVSVMVLGGPGYPEALAADHEAPAVLFARGTTASLDAPRVAIIGSRRCSPGGRDVARAFGRQLASAGACVVSGLALGIDGAAHGGAIAAGAAPPAAVVGSGLDVVYPSRHRELWGAVAAAGVILSEAPLGAAPEPWRFPARNRILAALADVVLVVEAQPASGSRYTVDAALDRGVPVLAVPGSITNPAAAGSNRLIRDGCGIACDAEDVLAVLGLSSAGGGRGGEGAGCRRRPPEGVAATVLAAVDWGPTLLDRVIGRTGLSPTAAATHLTALEMDGWVRGQSGSWERVAHE